MLTITQRECRLGAKYSGKLVEKDGDEHRTVKFELENIVLEANELNALLGEPHAHRALYDTSRSGVRPFLKCLKALELAKACESARVTLSWSMGAEQVVFPDAKLTKLKLELQEGGLTAMSCVVESEPALDETLTELLARLGHGIEVEIHAEQYGAQQDLQLGNRFGEGEQPDEPSPPRRRSRPVAH